MERVDIEEKNNINYSIYIDYAHTVDSLEKMFQTFKDKKIIHIFGSDGGGRDTAKRPLLGELSDKYSQNIILTEENPYNDNNFEIMNSIKFGIKRKELDKDLFIINNRREAIRKGIEIADKSNDENTVLLITGKGSEPYIVRANNQKEEWLDVAVVKELIEERK
ncbi:MAG: cyanophycin synthetase [Cyanobium sp. MAG06]|nr:cyanophycin synthetase [Cyanobium sp. MAG06]